MVAAFLSTRAGEPTYGRGDDAATTAKFAKKLED
jgi:hypothetical protein